MTSVDRIIQHEIGRINIHLPKRRLSLSSLLNQREPGVVLRDGEVHGFRRGELEFIASLLDEDERGSLLLPIILEIGPLDKGHFRVRGRVAVKVVDKILNTYDPLDERVEKVYPRYLLPKLRRALPTTTTYAFIPE